MTTRRCAHCGQEFETSPRGGRRQYCSDACRAAAWRTRRNPRSEGTANRQALEAMLADVILPASVAPLVQAARSLASAVDQWPANVGLWARYQAALDALRAVVVAEEDRAFERLLAEINAHNPYRDGG